MPFNESNTVEQMILDTMTSKAKGTGKPLVLHEDAEPGWGGSLGGDLADAASTPVKWDYQSVAEVPRQVEYAIRDVSHLPYARRADTTSAGAVRPRDAVLHETKARRADTTIPKVSHEHSSAIALSHRLQHKKSSAICLGLMCRPFGPFFFGFPSPGPHGPGKGCFGPFGPASQRIRWPQMTWLF
jgi:hypothetical protein